MKLYNTKSKTIEEFKPIDKNEVKIYTCGPTVYGYQHIGNYASYIYWDLLVRTLEANGYKVSRILNLTDVGHLTSDGDFGEDKMEKGAKKAGKTVWEIADLYISDFLTNFKKLNLIYPTKVCRATDYIEKDKAFVDRMTKNGYTYETADGIYFDTSKFPAYADFAKLDLKGLKAGARVDYSNEKRNSSDFAVWKFIAPGERHAMRWDYLGRPGYPGWHLECSTIISEELGEPIDIHTGGIDHIPVHHTNEIAQTFGATGKTLANYWLHANFITIDNQKISKSLGNIYTLRDLESRGFTPMDYKMWVLSGTYSGTRNFTFEDLSAAKNRRLSWRNHIAILYQNPDIPKTDVSKLKTGLLALVNNNLNSASAFSFIDSAASLAPLEFWVYVDELFGLNLIKDSPNVSEEIQALLTKRKEARENKDFASSDILRDALKTEGILPMDTKSGQIWQYLS